MMRTHSPPRAGQRKGLIPPPFLGPLSHLLWPTELSLPSHHLLKSPLLLPLGVTFTFTKQKGFFRWLWPVLYLNGWRSHSRTRWKLNPGSSPYTFSFLKPKNNKGTQYIIGFCCCHFLCFSFALCCYCFLFCYCRLKGIKENDLCIKFLSQQFFAEQKSSAHAHCQSFLCLPRPVASSSLARVLSSQ